jgi:AcrR family transcriptional regulator
MQPRKLRADAQRNVDALLEAAKNVTDLAGVGVGTLYRHFPQRADLVVAVLHRGIDACAVAGPALSAENVPEAALAKWLRRYTEFVGTKRGLATALHSGDPAFDGLPGYFVERLEPVLGTLLDAAVATGGIRADVSAKDLMHANALLCQPVRGEGID